MLNFVKKKGDIKKMSKQAWAGGVGGWGGWVKSKLKLISAKSEALYWAWLSLAKRKKGTAGNGKIICKIKF